MSLIIINNVILLLMVQSFSHDLPSYFPKCHLDSPDLNKCIGIAANQLRPYIKKGIQEIDFPSFDPLIVSNMTVVQASDVLDYTVTVNNYTVQGLDNYNLTDLRYNPKTKTFNGTVEFDSLFTSTLYKGKGRLVSIPIEGAGTSNIDYGKINGTFEVVGKIVKRKGLEYYKPIETTVRMLIMNSSYHFTGLFDGNEQLGRFTNNMVNRFSKVITDAQTPVLEKLAEKGLITLMKSLMLRVPYQELFPSSNTSK